MTAEAALYGRGAQKKPAVAEAHIVRIARGIKKNRLLEMVKCA